MILAAVLDSNAVDHIIDRPELKSRVELAVRSGRIRLLYSHITIDELALIPDSNRQRREDLLSWLTTFCSPVPTGGFVLDTSRLDLARIGDAAGVIPYLQSDRGDHTHDALIGATARYEQAHLVTYDKRLANRAKATGIVAATWEVVVDQLVDP